jgi:general stress protein 26
MSEPRLVPIKFWGTERAAPAIAWDRVQNLLETAPTYWVTTSNADGRPQARPVWGRWHADRLILSVGSTTIWRNFRANPNVSVHLPSGSEVVVLEGIASEEKDAALLEPWLAGYNPKYGWNLSADDPGGFVTVRPTTVLAWIATPLDSSPDGESLFPRAASKWVWD